VLRLTPRPPPPVPSHRLAHPPLQPDQGSGHFAETVRALKAAKPALRVECLTPDFRGVAAPIELVARSGLDVFAHNVETVERMQARVRDHRAGYRQSLSVLEIAKAAVPTLLTKTSLMLGVGERPDEIRGALRDLRASGVDVVTFGQYLRPSRRHMPVDRYVTPAEFDEWRAEGEAMGFLYVASGPLVRSSYKAGEYFLEAYLAGRLPSSSAVPRAPEAR
jgi:lipoic acid synthetase